MKKKYSGLKEFFLDHSLMHYGASLSFHTLLSMIPILLISFFLFSKLHIFDRYFLQVKNFIFSFIIPTNQDVFSQNIDKFMTNTAHLGVIGVVFILYVSVMFFDDFEYVVNKVFKVKPRRFFHSITLYITISILAPVGIALSIFISAYASTPIITHIVIWMIFFMLYKVSANTKVYMRSAAISSFIASTIWSISKYLFVVYITYNETYSTIYGSFSVIMFFLIWLYLSWIIFLYGVKLCYRLNLKESYEKNINSTDIN
jgi:membrane protein